MAETVALKTADTSSIELGELRHKIECLSKQVQKLTRSETDFKNVLLALLAEPDGPAIIQRVTTYAIQQRSPS